MTDTEPKLVDLPTSHALEIWLKIAPPGAQITYATGAFITEERRSAAKAAYDAYERGKVELAQRRNGNGFDYLAQKRRDTVRPFQPPILRGDVRKG
jgi:hypothetical protein